MVQYWESAELDKIVTLAVMAELQGFIPSLLSIKEKYQSPYVAYLPEGHMNFDNILFY